MAIQISFHVKQRQLAPPISPISKPQETISGISPSCLCCFLTIALHLALYLASLPDGKNLQFCEWTTENFPAGMALQ